MLVVVPWWIIYTALGVVAVTVLLLLLWMLAELWWSWLKSVLAAKKLWTRYRAFLVQEARRESAGKHLPRLDLSDGGMDADR